MRVSGHTCVSLNLEGCPQWNPIGVYTGPIGICYILLYSFILVDDTKRHIFISDALDSSILQAGLNCLQENEKKL